MHCVSSPQKPCLLAGRFTSFCLAVRRKRAPDSPRRQTDTTAVVRFAYLRLAAPARAHHRGILARHRWGVLLAKLENFFLGNGLPFFVILKNVTYARPVCSPMRET